MRSTEELLSKIKTKYGRNHCLLDIPDKPRRKSVATFRLFTGHDCLAAHLYRIGFLTKAACPLSDKRNEPMDKYHLRTCGALHRNTESLIYWEARGLMGRLSPVI
ncbi:RNase H domain-containing protein [Nephila pilipes]|uniref:RNase H domain-containing protein n=1 Tax=Nephila pilipes TaxID=299642 RepID=A0A8X6U5Q9_NEPPI|nr:RNase H domain-containing protein [Nephila pilipes]